MPIHYRHSRKSISVRMEENSMNKQRRNQLANIVSRLEEIR